MRPVCSLPSSGSYLSQEYEHTHTPLPSVLTLWQFLLAYIFMFV